MRYTWASGGGSDGALIQVGSKLYGTTVTGGSYNEGTVFGVSPSGTLKTLYSFCPHSGCADGSQPMAGLVLAPNGELYGTTNTGGTGGGGGFGTVFKVTTRGRFASLVSFQSGTAPANPTAPLTLASDGTLYGTTTDGGEPSNGFVYQIANDTLANAWPLTGNTGCVGGTPYGGLLLASNGSFYGSDDNGNCADAGTLFEFSLAKPKK